MNPEAKPSLLALAETLLRTAHLRSEVLEGDGRPTRLQVGPLLIYCHERPAEHRPDLWFCTTGCTPLGPATAIDQVATRITTHLHPLMTSSPPPASVPRPQTPPDELR